MYSIVILFSFVENVKPVTYLFFLPSWKQNMFYTINMRRRSALVLTWSTLWEPSVWKRTWHCQPLLWLGIRAPGKALSSKHCLESLSPEAVVRIHSCSAVRMHRAIVMWWVSVSLEPSACAWTLWDKYRIFSFPRFAWLADIGTNGSKAFVYYHKDFDGENTSKEAILILICGTLSAVVRSCIDMLYCLQLGRNSF